MGFIDFLKEFFSGPDAAFSKLARPDFFSSQKAKLFSLEDYARWLRQIAAQYEAMAEIRRQEGGPIPVQWQSGLERIQEEIERVKKEGGFGYLKKK